MPLSDEFLWGAATSSHQIEGGNDHSDWAEFERDGRVDGGVRSGRATDHWVRFREDLELAASLGLTAYRFSVEWSRIEPEDGKWDVSAIGWYRQLIAECERLGLAPMLTLHHFTSPLWFAKKGGFAWSEAPDRFARFTAKIVEELGARVPHWCTLNEPMVLATGGYIGGFMPPGKFDAEGFARVCAGLLRSHVRAYDVIHSGITRREGPWRDRPLIVGIAHNMVDFIPDRAWHPLEVALTAIVRRFYNKSWLDAVTGGPQRFGVPGLIPRAPRVPEAQGRRTVDFLGVNYYTKGYVRWRPRDGGADVSTKLPIGISFARRKEAASDLGWAIHPSGFARVLREASEYGLPLYVTENGIADHDDDLRPSYLASHLEELMKLVREGVDVRGYYHWSLLDNFEWIKGFWPRFGLFRVDYGTFERTPTSSARLYAKLIAGYRGK